MQEHQNKQRGKTFSELLFREWTLNKDQEKWKEEAKKIETKDTFSTEAILQE